MHIVLIHGIFDSGAVFKHLAQRLRAQGHQCWLPNLKPADARHGIDDLARKLNAYLDAHLPPNAPIAIVGFSMGCIIARRYLQQMGGYRRTKAFFAISGPHRGTLLAFGYIGQGARDMRPGSALLGELAASEACLNNMVLRSYWTPRDITIVPPRSSVWPSNAHSVKTGAWLHRWMTRDHLVCRDIEAQLAAMGGIA